MTLSVMTVRMLSLLLFGLGSIPLAWEVLLAYRPSRQEASTVAVSPLYVRPPMVALPLPPDGTFWMGSSEEEEGRDPNERRHRVTLAGPFALSETEVTQAQYSLVMRRTQSQEGARKDVDPEPWVAAKRKTAPELPATDVSWYDAAEYTNRLSTLEGLEPCYVGVPPDVTLKSLSCRGYRLPTEAEWEYAARAGGRWTRYAGTDDDAKRCEVAVVDGCSDGADPSKPFDSAQPVKSRRENGWGLYDMSGNVWEWVGDWYDENYYQAPSPVDVGGPAKGGLRVLRGGSWWFIPQDARVSNRVRRSPDDRNDYQGFRLSRSLR